MLTTGLSNHSNNVNINKNTPNINQHNQMDNNLMYNVNNMNMMQNNSSFGAKSLDYNSDEIGN